MKDRLTSGGPIVLLIFLLEPREEKILKKNTRPFLMPLSNPPYSNRKIIIFLPDGDDARAVFRNDGNLRVSVRRRIKEKIPTPFN